MLHVGLLLMRSVAGITIYIHGSQKLFGTYDGPGIAGTTAFLRKIGLRPARLMAYCVALAQTFGGLGIVLGFATPISAGLSAITLFVAVNFLFPKGFSAAKGGYEYALLLAFSAFSLIFTGPGNISIDHLLDDRFTHRWLAQSSAIISIVIAGILVLRQNSYKKKLDPGSVL